MVLAPTQALECKQTLLQKYTLFRPRAAIMAFNSNNTINSSSGAISTRLTEARQRVRCGMYVEFLDAIASPSTYSCQWVSE